MLLNKEDIKYSIFYLRTWRISQQDVVSIPSRVFGYGVMNTRASD